MWTLYWIVFSVLFPILYIRTEKSEEKKYRRKQKQMNNKAAIETKSFLLRVSLWHFLLLLRLAKWKDNLIC